MPAVQHGRSRQDVTTQEGRGVREEVAYLCGSSTQEDKDSHRQSCCLHRQWGTW